MSEIKDQLQKQLLAAMKGGSDAEKRTLKMLKAEVLNEETKAGASEIDKEAFQKIVQSMIKKRRQSISEFEKAGRQDLADGEHEEIAVLETFLPPAVKAEDIEAVVDKLLEQAKADGQEPHTGRLTGQVMGQFKGQNIDGKLVSEIIRKSVS